jgi:hypothetical protein
LPAVSLEGLADLAGAAVVVRGCRFNRTGQGVRVSGQSGPATPQPCHNVVVRDNTLTDCNGGVVVLGQVTRLQIVGNRFLGAKVTAVQLNNLMAGSSDIQVANNTVVESVRPFSFFGSAARGFFGTGVRFANNLCTRAEGLDLVFFETDDDPKSPGRPGDGRVIARTYVFKSNWREALPAADWEAQGWVPKADKDVLQAKIDGIDRDPKSPTFLRPAKDSPLATQGAGAEDPSLPSYVGAVPPEGVEPWDWDRTWRMPAGAQLLTVSKDEKGGGKYRTITEALKDAKPWATVRVLDDGTYPESLQVNNPDRHRGVSVETVGRATIALPADTAQGIAIRDVPDFRLANFRVTLEELTKPRAFILVVGAVPGVELRGLDLVLSPGALGLGISRVAVPSGGRPVVVRGCTIQGGSRGVDVRDSRGVCLWDNRVSRCEEGIQLSGTLSDVHVAGNAVWGCSGTTIDLEDFRQQSAGVLIANNTLHDSKVLLRIYDYPPYEEYRPGQAELAGNLLFGVAHADMVLLRSPGQPDIPQAADGAPVTAAWAFRNNWRDLTGIYAAEAIPKAPGDRVVERAVFPPSERSRPDFLRPQPDSPLATGGAGSEDPALPRYAGAIPPDGVPRWDWDRTWRARVPNAPPAK